MLNKHPFLGVFLIFWGFKFLSMNLRSKRPRRHVTARHRRIRPTVTAVDQCWSMDFVADNLFNGRRILALTVVDNFSRECVAIEGGQGLRGDDVVAVMERIRQTQQRVPQRLQTDNGSEFISKTLERWAYENRVTMDFSCPVSAPLITPWLSHLTAVCVMNV